MTLGSKEKFTGTVRRERLHVGSKSERDAIVIVLDEHAAPYFEIRVKGSNPFHDESLESFVGKKVSIEGIKGSGVLAVFVDSVSDISIINPPNKPKNPSPKM